MFVTTDDERIADACSGLRRRRDHDLARMPQRHRALRRGAASLARSGPGHQFPGRRAADPAGFRRSAHRAYATTTATRWSRRRRCGCAASEVRALQAEEAAGRVGGTCVVTDGHGYALYFSKRLIPHLPKGALDGEMSPVRLHVGVYAYRPEALDAMPRRRSASWKTLEGLEQLRFLVARHADRGGRGRDAALRPARAQQSRGRRADRGRRSIDAGLE